MCETVTRYFTSVEVAKAVGVGESSVKRWIDSGVLEASKTPGGHRRVAMTDLYRFLLATGRKLADPQSLGIGSAAELGEPRAYVATLESALRAGDPLACEDAMRLMRLAGAPAAQIFDAALYPAFQAIRASCEHPSEACLVLHRAIGIVQNLLTATVAPFAAGPTKRARVVFADVGYEVDGLPTYLAEATVWDRAHCLQLGVAVPVEVIEGALGTFRADQLWLSASGPLRRGLAAEWRRITSRASDEGVQVVAFGGLALELARGASITCPNFSAFSARFAG